MVANHLLCVSKLGHTGRSCSFFPTASGHYLYVHARYVADWFSFSRAIGSGDSNKQGLAGELKCRTFQEFEKLALLMWSANLIMGSPSQELPLHTDMGASTTNVI